MSKEQLQSWRNEFWGKFVRMSDFLETRSSGSPEVWMLLRTVCDEIEDSGDGQAMILASDLKMPNNSLTLVIDQQGVYYRIPIACINEPNKYQVGNIEEQLAKKERPPEFQYKDLKVRNALKGDHQF